MQELDDSVPGEAAPAAAALRSVLLDVFNEHDYNKDGKVGCRCICTHAHAMCYIRATRQPPSARLPTYDTCATVALVATQPIRV